MSSSLVLAETWFLPGQTIRLLKTYYTQLRLDPLPPASADTFLRALLGDDPSLTSLTQFLIQRTEGNPFFPEESVRTLVETRSLMGATSNVRGVRV